MAKDLLNMDRLPTMEELKQFFKENDWTSMKINDPAQRTAEERAEVAYVVGVMDKEFEKQARKKGRKSAKKYYSKDNPLIALQTNTEDLVASAVVKIANDDELLDGILSQFDFTDPDLDKKADAFLHNAVDTMLNVMDYEQMAAIIHEDSSEEDFNTNIENNFRYKDHIRRVEHTDAKTENILCPDPEAKLRKAETSVEDEALQNVLAEQFMATLDETDKKIFAMKRLGYTQKDIAEAVGFSGNAAVSKRLAIMKENFHKMLQ